MALSWQEGGVSGHTSGHLIKESFEIQKKRKSQSRKIITVVQVKDDTDNGEEVDIMRTQIQNIF